MPTNREHFDALFDTWRQDLARPEVALHSSTDAWTQLPSFRAIVDLGRDALPLIFERLAAGYFELNEAAAEITGVDLRARLAPDIGEQGLSLAWVEWWAENRSQF